MKGITAAGVCVAAAAAAFVAGRASGGGAADDGGASDPKQVAALERRVEELTKRLADERARRPRAENASARAAAPGEEPDDATTAAPQDDPRTESAGSAPPGDVKAFSLDGISSPEEGSKRFMEFVDANLRRGPEGYAAILEAMNEIWRRKDVVESLFGGDETVAAKQLYPWVRFSVEHEGQILDFSEHVFRTMAERPEAFEATPDDDVLQFFTEGVAFLLPGAVPEDRLGRFRGYATKILETPESKQPTALRQNRRRIERVLSRNWAPPATPEQALELLRAGRVAPRDVARLLRLVPKDALDQLDLTALVEPILREGNYDAIRVLAALPPERLDRGRVDAALLAAMESGNVHGSFVANCLRPGRSQFSDVRPLLDRAFGSNESARNCAAQILSGMLPRNLWPDRQYVEDVLARGVVPEAMVQSVKQTYAIR